MPGVSLSRRGHLEARRLGTWLVGAGIDVVVTSPLERCVATGNAIASPLGMVPKVMKDLTEIDFGAWTGRALGELIADPGWTRFNTCRSEAAVPGGESMHEVERRAVDAAERLCYAHPGETLAIVTHGDVIKAIVAHTLGTGLDHLDRFDVDPASVTTIVHEGRGWRVVGLNESPESGPARLRTSVGNAALEGSPP
jgi:broad specificity phosphatase PhoE